MLKRLISMSYFVAAMAVSSSAQDFSYQTGNEGVNASFKPVVTSLPDVFSFTRYGDIPIGLYTGTMNYSIPLFNITSGKLNVPITLEYSTNGVKVNDVGSRTGIDWVLKAGGVITKTVMGKEDGLASVLPPANVQANPLGSDSVNFYNWMKMVGDNSNHYDTQPDEYTYNFLGHVGKFYIDFSGNIRKITQSTLKISHTNGTFTIIADDGTQYFFSPLSSTVGVNSYYADTYNVSAASTAWGLSKIMDIFGDVIIFKYNTSGSGTLNSPLATSYISDIRQTMKVGLSGHYAPYLKFITGNGYLDPLTGIYIGCINDGISSGTDMRSCPEDGSGFPVTDVQNTTGNSLALSEIQYNHGKVKFYYSNRSDLPTDIKLDSIESVDNTNGELVKTVGFRYDQVSSNSEYENSSFTESRGNLNEVFPYLRKRLFLKSVFIYGHNGTQPEKFGFVYDQPHLLPPRLSFSQDFWGYFNGKKNTSLIPDNTPLHRSYGGGSYNSTRSPNPFFSKKGTLIKINYPTGGFTNIEYESNLLAEHQLEKLDTIRHSINEYGGGSWETVSNTFSVNEPVEIRISSEWVEMPDPNGPQPGDPMVMFRLENITDPSNNPHFLDRNVPVGQNIVINNNLHLLNPNDLYRIRLTASESYIRGSAEIVRRRYVSENKATGGVRVRSVKNYSGEGKVENTKIFSYNHPNSPFSSGGSIYHYNDALDYMYWQKSLCSSMYLYEFFVTSHSILGNYANDYAAVNYEYVTVSYDSTHNAGSIVTKFKREPNTIATTFACGLPILVSDRSPYLIQNAPLSNTGIFNGKEEIKSFYKWQQGNLVKEKEILNFYSSDPRLYGEQTFYIVRKNFTRPAYISNLRYWIDYDVNAYRRISSWIHLDSVVTREFLNGDTILSRENFQYGSPIHQNVTNRMFNIHTQKWSKSTFKYPTEIVQNGGDPTGLYQSMIHANILTPVIEKTDFIGNKQTLFTRTNYADFSGNYLPKSIEIQNGTNQIETRQLFNAYDAKGNLLEQQKANGMKETYLWGYGGQFPIAEIKNATYSEVFDVLGQTTINNLNAFNVTETTINNAMSKLRTDSRLSKAMVTSYTYQPLVGMKSKTDPRGVTEYYEYDGMQRLKAVLDQVKNVTSSMDYHYRPN